MNAAPSEHASARRDGVSVWLLLAALATGPTAWILQLVIGYGLASHACFPRETPHLDGLPVPWSVEPGWLVAVNLACLCLAIGGAALSWWSRRGARAGAGPEPRVGRTRFLANCGVLAGAGFALAILFDTAEPLMVAACWRLVP